MRYRRSGRRELKQGKRTGAGGFGDDSVAVVECTGPAGLRDGLRAIESNTSVRAVVVNMTGILESTPGSEELQELVSGFLSPVVLAADGNVKGWAADVLLAANICFADASTSIEFDENTDLSAYAERCNPKDFDFRVLSAERAIELGIVNSMGVETRAVEAAGNTAKRISQMAPLAVRACLAAVGNARCSRGECWENEAHLFSALFDSEDMKRGTGSFLEGTKPHFRGN